jgi:hypothetical protein
LDLEEGAQILISGRLRRRRDEMDGGDASWRSVENPMDRRISQICEKVKAECIFGISAFWGLAFWKSR